MMASRTTTAAFSVLARTSIRTCLQPGNPFARPATAVRTLHQAPDQAHLKGVRRPIGARLYSRAASPIKIWNFEEVQALWKDPKETIVLVDVREPGELRDTGRIPGAINIPIKTLPDSFHITDEEFEDRFGHPRPSKDSELLIYCKAGVRAHAAAVLAQDAGWSNVGEYPGSWLDWAERGGETQK